MLRSAAQAILQWLCVPFTASGRRGFPWYVDADIAGTVQRSGALPAVSWSQDGEDLAIDESWPQDGRYVDVGAHHPDRFSLTRRLYERGWQGINIDFMVGFPEALEQARPRDINVRAIVGSARTVQFFRFQEEALNTIDSDRARALIAGAQQLASTETVQAQPLSQILESVGYVGPIDFLNVDVEGADLEVLASLDWHRWPVRRCLVELSMPAHRVHDHPVAQFLQARGMHVTRVWTRSCLFESVFESGN